MPLKNKPYSFSIKSSFDQRNAKARVIIDRKRKVIFLKPPVIIDVVQKLFFFYFCVVLDECVLHFKGARHRHIK